jgi:hypothetical protein
VCKERSSVGSSQNAPIRVLQQHFEDKSKVLFKASNHQGDSGRYKFSSRQALQARKLSLSLSSSKEALSKSSQASFIYA